jgi:phosphoribosylglycinamide formyltransferase-1
MFRIVVLLSGRGSNFKALYRALESNSSEARIVGVISDNPNADGISFAKSHEVPCTLVPRDKNKKPLDQFFKELHKTVSDYQPDLVVLAGFMRIVPDSLINEFAGRMINIHPSLLPSFKGLHAHKQALQAGVKISGCTVHYVVPEIDSGAIIAQAAVPVFANDTEQSLSERILIEEHKLLPKVVKLIAAKKVKLIDEKVIIED